MIQREPLAEALACQTSKRQKSGTQNRLICCHVLFNHPPHRRLRHVGLIQLVDPPKWAVSFWILFKPSPDRGPLHDARVDPQLRVAESFVNLRHSRIGNSKCVSGQGQPPPLHPRDPETVKPLGVEGGTL